jgi:hypothetical protein
VKLCHLAEPRLLHRQRMLGAPFKPGFGLSGIPQHSTRRFLSLGVERSVMERSAVTLGMLTGTKFRKDNR